MDYDVLLVLIQVKLDEGRLPHNSIPRIWGGPGNGESCDACEETIPPAQLIMEGINPNRQSVQFHVLCFALWERLRKAPGR